MTDDLDSAEQARALLLWHVEAVSHRLRSKHLVAGGITLKIRYGDFETITRSASLEPPSSSSAELWRVALATFDQWANKDWHALRLLGFGVDRLADATGQQAGLFEQTDRSSALDAAKDAVMDKFGKSAISSAGALQSRRRDR